MKRIGILLVLILAAGCGRRVQREGEVATSSVDISGTYLLDARASTDFVNRAHKYVILNGVAQKHPVEVTQTEDSLRFVFWPSPRETKTNVVENIGGKGSSWWWTKDGLACKARPSWPFNFYMLPGAVHLDQTCTITQEEDGSLVIERSTAEGGRAFWLIPWKDPAWTSKLTLRKQGDVTTTKSTLSSEAAPSAAPSER